MYVIIVGAKKIGSYLAKTLIEEGCDVVVIDKDSEVCREISSELECVTIRGDATKPKVLEEAGVREADTLIALTGSDETNLIICLMAKQLGAKQVAAKLGALHYDEVILKKIGLDLAIYPELATSDYISTLITKPEVHTLGFFAKGDAEILEMKIDKKSKLVNRSVKEIKIPDESKIISITRKGKTIIAELGMKIAAEDMVLILVKKEKVDQVKKIFGVKVAKPYFPKILRRLGV